MIKILTSGFTDGFPKPFSEQLEKYINAEMSFAFVASEFRNIHDKTDWYCDYFLKMFSDCGLSYKKVQVIDGRMTESQAQGAITESDVVWLAGGDTRTQYKYFEEFGIVSCLREHKGIVIGMSAGSINMSNTAICTVTCEHDSQCIYEALGIVDFSVEPHFTKDKITKELLKLSENYPLYGICDDSAIVCYDGKKTILGDVYLIENGKVIQQ